MSIVNALSQNLNQFPHPVTAFSVIETHLSWILLTGKYAYKIKKPLNLGFADFSTLEKRHFYTQEELELNRKITPSLYLKTIPIYGSIDHPQFKSDGKPPIEYALKMQEFSPSDLMTQWIKGSTKIERESSLTKFAEDLAQFHQHAPALPKNSPYGNVSKLKITLLDNFKTILSASQHPEIVQIAQTLKNWTETQWVILEPLLRSRYQKGAIRRLHGDLHMGNIVWFQNKLCAFDCIEFNPEFQWIDPLNDLAFLVMDLEFQSYQHEAYLLLNAYLDHTADYEGLPLLTLYKVYRTLVRTKIAFLSPHKNEEARDAVALSYLNYANALSQRPSPCRPGFILMHGYCGSGKSHLATNLGKHLPILVLRTDVLRYRLFHSAIYSSENRLKVYQTLFNISKQLISQNQALLIDGSFLQKRYRQLFSDFAEASQMPWILLDQQISLNELKIRLNHRNQKKKNHFGSEANLEVLAIQQREFEPLDTNEQKHSFSVLPDTDLNFIVKYSIQKLL